MWRKFKIWLCRDILDQMEEYLQSERRHLHEQIMREHDFVLMKHGNIMRENEVLSKMITERAMFDPQPPVLVKR